MPSWYAVACGHKTGTYETWDQCNEQVNKYPGAKYKKFDRREDADAFVAAEHASEKVTDIPVKTNSDGASKRENIFYAVARGHKPGIYYSWSDCLKEVDKFSGARYKKFKSEKEAQDFINGSVLPMDALNANASRIALEDEAYDHISTDEDIDQNYSTLSVEQQNLYDYVVNGTEARAKYLIEVKEAEKNGLPVPRQPDQAKQILHFQSGVAGTGKSVVIRAIVNRLNKCGKLIARCAAPTGIAAYNINANGSTLHHMFSLRFGEYEEMGDQKRRALQLEWSDTLLLIIDEASMLSDTMLVKIHRRLNELFHKSDTDGVVFGGINLMLTGDLLQLPPVKANFLFENKDLWVQRITYGELMVNHRQKDDASYFDLLARVRLGKVTEDDLKLLRGRLYEPTGDPTTDGKPREIARLAAFYDTLCQENPGKSIVCIVPVNKTATEFNSAMLKQRNITSVTSFAFKLPTAAEEPDQSKVEEREFVFGLEARVILRRNISVREGLVNGALGIVKHIEYDSSQQPKIVHVLFDGHKEHTPVERWKCAVGRQFPLTLAWALSCHKSQGLTMDAVLVDIGDDAYFADGLAYVALSRAKKLENVHLIALNPKIIKCSKSALREYDRLQKSIPQAPSINH